MQNFLDYLELYIKSGDGGNGIIAFLREPYNPKGGPAGGDGGKGGDVIIVSDATLRSLNNYRFTHHLKAGTGGNGSNNNRKGESGKDLIIKVPVGTVIYDGDHNILHDIQKDKESIVILSGGLGGRGNASFRSSVMQKPYFALKGEQGEERKIILELKLFADIAIVGFPNAGKSTLISSVSNAKPKIANYPFTTLIPNLGIVKYKFIEMIFADIPGLIEGASYGKGLGLRFLKHIERSKALIFLLDPKNDLKCSDQLRILKKEIKKYHPKLAEKSFFVAISKKDLLTEDEIRQIDKSIKQKILFISAQGKTGLEQLTENAYGVLCDLPKVEAGSIRIKRYTSDRSPLIESIEKIDEKVFILKGRIEKIVSQIDFEQYDAMYYFKKIVSQKELRSILTKNGVNEGDTIIIGEKEFTYKKE